MSQLSAKKTPWHDEDQSGLSQTFESDLHLVCALEHGTQAMQKLCGGTAAMTYPLSMDGRVVKPSEFWKGG